MAFFSTLKSCQVEEGVDLFFQKGKTQGRGCWCLHGDFREYAEPVCFPALAEARPVWWGIALSVPVVHSLREPSPPARVEPQGLQEQRDQGLPRASLGTHTFPLTLMAFFIPRNTLEPFKARSGTPFPGFSP